MCSPKRERFGMGRESFIGFHWLQQCCLGVKDSTQKSKPQFAGILERNTILIPTRRKRLIHLLLPLNGPRFLLWLLIIRHRHVADDRTLLASVPLLPA
jgi:hypothetical protein